MNTTCLGKGDAEVEMVSALTFDERRELNAGMEFFLHVLLGNQPANQNPPARNASRSVAGATQAGRGRGPPS